MNIENEVQPLAMVTHHLVHEVACSDPDTFIDEYGEIRKYAVLEYLGFKVSHNLYNKDIVEMPNTIVRTKDKPYMTYYADVYKGHIKRKKCGTNGVKSLYKYHSLYKDYEKYGILQPNNLELYVREEDLTDITEIGFY